MADDMPINIPLDCTMANDWGHGKWQLVHEPSGMEFQADLRGAHKITFVHAATNDMSSTAYYIHESQVTKHPNAATIMAELKMIEDTDDMDSWWYTTSDDELIERLLAMPV